MINFAKDYRNFDVLIDVRSPGEFEHSHIPTAYNFPLFNDAEFKQIGTLYHQDSIKASLLGASIGCKNIASFLQEVLHNPTLYKRISHKNKILLYCARGGKRSQAFYEVLKNLNFQVYKLEGGYKSYRQLVLQNLKKDYKFITLCGPTGCGKSEILQHCKEISIDLETLAHHYGSSFGGLANKKLGKAPSQKMFENQLEFELTHKQHHAPLLIEAESKKLGDSFFPKNIYDQYQKGIFVLIDAPMEARVNRIVAIYQEIEEELFLTAMQKIKPYITNNIFQTLLKLWENQELSNIAYLLIEKYYDKVYKIPKHHYKINNNNIQESINILQELRQMHT